MHAANLIGPEQQTTPADWQPRLGHTRPLPDDLLREASRRVGIMALLGAALWITGPFLGHLAASVMAPADPGWRRLYSSDWIALVAMAVSVGVYVFTRRTSRKPRFILDLGLIHLVFNAFAIGTMWHWDAYGREVMIFPMITWIGAVILIFPAIVPTTPLKMFVAGLLAASMGPFGMFLAKVRHFWDYGPPGNLLLMHYPDFIMVAVAVVIATVVTRLGQQVAKAREMGSYQLGALIGKGGMGEVYRATHRMLARPAAIKLIRPETIAAGGGDAAQLAVSRFRREAEVAASLRSPHTVELYDFGVTDNQTLYFVMELLEGMNLEAMVRRYGRVPPSRTIHILRQVCESLEEAHDRNLVHRDIKPANIHIGRLGLRRDFVKVLDFGLVKSIVGNTGEHSMATGTGLTPGTPDYMAPEMLMGEAIDGRADLYAVGCVAYTLLTGVPVFEAPGVIAVMAKHLNEAPVRPSIRAGIEVPAALEELVLACLAKRPADRPSDAGKLGRALDGIAVEPWTQDDAARWWSAHPAD
ncbi:MAG TPA: serine/threonine-protein kinase [Gemmatimonadales bacterium]|nr:serine/threonine-protein kinase [Gemmatimonadales bacterium]